MTALATPWHVHERPSGDFTVDRSGTRGIVRWGVYKSREEAQRVADECNRLGVTGEPSLTLTAERAL